MEHANWIAGAPRTATGTFELVGPGHRGASLGSWPRSTEADLQKALAAAREGGVRWRELSALERARRLADAARDLATDPDPEGLLGLALGVEDTVVARHARGIRSALEGTLRAGPERGAPRSETSLVRRHWSELFNGWIAPLAELAAGRAVVFLSDPVLPTLADRFARALADAGVPPGALGVLHDDGETVLRAALRGRLCQRLVASGHTRLRRHLTELLDRTGSGDGPRPFGAGVVEATPVEMRFTRLEKSTARIGPDEDPEERAETLARRAFGRAATLGGQLPGQVGRVVCHPGLFSRFTETLLGLLESGAEHLRPPPLLDRDLPTELARARDLGLDEGATLILEQEASSRRIGQPNARVERLVFTNVEPGTRITALTRPAPLLLLMRSRREGPAPGPP